MSTPLIEDALKSSRNFHRLIITVSLVSIVFAMSLSLPENLVTIKDTINQLRTYDLLEYEQFAIDRAKSYAKEKLQSEHDKLEAFFEGGGWMVFQTNHISEKFLEPVHVGRILVNETALANLDDATITQLNSISAALEINKNVQVLIPHASEVFSELTEFFNENSKIGSRISNVQLGMEEVSTIAESFLPDISQTVHLYFELVSAGPFMAAPIFNTSFSGTVVEVPDTSFAFWLQNKQIDSDIAVVTDDGIRWLDFLPDPPEGYKQEKIGLLLKRINLEIETGSPAKQSVSILGTNVPGVLVVYATPLVLLALSYYFMQHSGHLARLVDKNAASFREFSWLPIVLGRYWWVETMFSILLLPILAIMLLNYKLSSFEDQPLVEILISVTSVALILICGSFVIGNLGRIRSALVSDSSEKFGAG